MNDELKKADEIVRALRIKSDCERFFKETGHCADCPMPHKESPNYERICVGFDEEMLPQAADLIESLTAQLTDYHHMEQLVDGKMTENQRLRHINETLQSQFTESQRREKAAVEDMVHDCSTCGCYEKCTDEWFKRDMNEDRCSCSDWEWRGPQADKGEAV